MTEYKNPFDDANFRSGLPLTEKVVTVLESKFTVDQLHYRDGSPVLDEKGNPSVRNVWSVTVVAEGEERERRFTYSIGALIPTADGEGFTRADGTLAQFHANSAAAKFSKALKASGFDVNKLFVDGKIKASALVGAKFELATENRKDKEGKDKVNERGYTEVDYYPATFVGTATFAANGNGHSDETKDKAQLIVTEILTENGGSMKQADLVRALSSKLGGGKETADIASIITRQEFFNTTGIKREGTTISL